MNIKSKISSDLDIPPDMIDEALLLSRKHVKKFYIKKRNGDKRAILQPSNKLKTIQYWLMYNVFNELPIHDCAMAYRDGVSILENAKRHRNNRYFLKIDFTDFFPSIKWTDFKSILDVWYQKSNVDWDYNNDAKNLIKKSCFYFHDRLPIGYPSSPVLSNVVMFDVDVKISKLIGDNTKYGNVVYTRYADDIVISTDKKGACKILLDDIAIIIKSSKSPNISINESKTKFGSSSGGSASVTGLKICNDGHITIHKKQKDHIRLLLGLYKKGILNPEEHSSLLGHLSYISHVSPDFYSKLQNLYFNEIYKLKSI